MARRAKLRQCPRCGYHTRNRRCCGIDLAPPRFKLTPRKIQFVRTLAHRQKGMDEEEYHRFLEEVTGRASTKDIRRRREFDALVKALQRLPDVRYYEKRRAA